MPISERDRSGLARPLLLALAVITTLGLASCSSRTSRPRLYPVHGSVLVRGKPAAKAVVVLRPVAGKLNELKDQIPHAEVGEDGQFQIGTFAANDGAPSGDYVVTVTWPQTRKDSLTGDEVVEDRLGQRYSVPERSPLKVTVKEGDNKIDPFRLN